MDRLLIVFSIALMLAACTWVKPTAEGEKVKIATAEEVTACKRLGKTSVSLLDKVAGIERNQQKVKTELETLARNSGADMGGNAVVAETQPKDGKQTFGVYECVH